MRRSRIFDVLLSRDPFTDIGRTIPEFRSIGRAAGEEFHGLPVDKQNVFEIDDEAASRLLFQHAPERIDVFARYLAADQ
jgi:hypothetical protein